MVTDPYAGKWELPGGHLETDETPAEAAVREWQEEVGLPLPDGELIAEWTSPNGVYRGYVWEIDSEDDLPLNINPVPRSADPDGDGVQTVAWWEPQDLSGNTALRDELHSTPWHELGITTNPVTLKSKKKTQTAIVTAGNQLVLTKPPKPGDKIIVEHSDGEEDEYNVKNYDDLGKADASHDAGRIGLYEELHERITQHYAPRIAHAMRNISGLHEAVEQARSVWPQYTKAAGDDENAVPDVTPVATEGFSESPQLGPIGSDIALSAIESNITFDKEGIKNTLQDIYQDAATAGIGIGNLQLSAIASWKPGNPSAADLVANGALREILTSLDITVKGLTDSAIDRMGNILAEGLNQGLSPLQIAKNMSEIIADPKRALVIARTETARAMGTSALLALKNAGNAQWVWHDNAGACATCVFNADNSPYPIDEGPVFPAHPNCRCQPLPYVDLS